METPRTCPTCGQPLAPDAPQGLCPPCLLKAGFATGPATTASGKAPAFTPPAPETLAAHFPKLEILGLLGQGGMGAVYRARQPELDRLVALKILPPQMAEAPGFAERFTREARALARLNHPHIVAVHDFGRTGGFPFLLMEFVDGVNLRQVERERRLAPREALEIIPQICDALQYAHDEGIVHRDIKPENILLDKKGRVKIADFGLAKLLGSDQPREAVTAAGHVMGTPHYMAPEQVERPLEVDHRADIYSLGVVFYEMLTGELPLGRFAPPSQRSTADARLDEVVMRTLEKEPAQRYQQASEVKTGVAAAASGRPTEPGPVPGWQWRWDAMAAIWAGKAFALVFSLVLLGFLARDYFRTPIYYAETRLQILRGGSDSGGTTDAARNALDPGNLRTTVALLESNGLAQAVVARMSYPEMQRFLAPYANGHAAAIQHPAEILQNTRSIRPVLGTYMIDVGFLHPDPEVAATVANLYAKEFIAGVRRQEDASTASTVGALVSRANLEKKKIDALQAKMDALEAQYGPYYLKRDGNLQDTQFNQQNAVLADSQRQLDAAKSRVEAMQAREKDGKPLWDLSFIATQPRVSALLAEYTTAKVTQTRLSQSLGPKHPDLVAITTMMNTLERQLQEAAHSAAQMIYSDLAQAQSVYDVTLARRDALAKENSVLFQAQADYAHMQHDLDLAQALYKEAMTSTQHEQARSQLEGVNFRIVETASRPSNPVTPNFTRAAMKGSFAGLLWGLGAAILAGGICCFRHRSLMVLAVLGALMVAGLLLTLA